MKKVSLLVVVVLVANLIFAQNHNFSFNGTDYVIVKEMQNWSEAATWATDNDGYLAEINSVEEQTAIWNEVIANVPVDYTTVGTGGDIAYVWIGATDQETEGTWLWDGNNDNTGENFWNGQGAAGANDGSAVNGAYINWGGTSTGTPNEPDNFFMAQHAAGIGMDAWPFGSGGTHGIAGEWNDIEASNDLYFIVEYNISNQSNENNILTFIFEEQTEEAIISIENHTVEIEVVAGTNLTNLIPTITISDLATIDPATGTAQNFSAPFEYTVTAENLDEQTWTVTVTVAEQQSDENDILTFIFEEQTGDAIISIENHTIEIEVEAETDISNLIPTITISDLATIDPATGTTQNFSAPFEYTVTAENLDEQTWTVTVTVATGIGNLSSNQISIYPNPSNGIFTITNYEFQITNVEITDITGKRIKQFVIRNSKFVIDLTNQPTGIYFLKINSNDGIYTEKIIIQ